MAEPHHYFKPLFADGGPHRKSHTELLHLVQGIVADGVVAEDEAAFLRRWITENESVHEVWPANVLYARIEAMLSDGLLDADEQHELLATMTRFVELRQIAERNRAEVDSLLDSASDAAESPFDAPSPQIVHRGRSFVVTGDFVSARQRDIESLILRLGGRIDSELSGASDYLVVGGLGLATWPDTRHAPMIQRALLLQHQGAPLHIVSEQHWHAAAARALASL